MYKIKRPLAVIGFAFFISGSIALSMPKEYTTVLLALFALFGFIHYSTRKVYTKHLMLMLVCAVMSVLYISVYSIVWHNKIDKISTETKVYKGYVTEINNSGNTLYTVAVLDDKNSEEFKVTLYYDNGFTVGDVLLVTGKFKPVKSNRYVFSSYADNILGTISAEEITAVSSDIKTVKYTALKAKKALLLSAEQMYGRVYEDVVKAIAYNDSHNLPDDVVAAFRTAGLSHALVVSGLHIWIVIGAVIRLLKFIPVSKKAKNIFAVAVMLAFMYIVGLSPSVMRAGMLAGIILVIKNFRKDQDYLTTLALIGMVCVVDNPYITRDIGAMLSYAASVGIVLANQWCRKRRITKHKSTLACATAAVLFTMPVLALADMRVTVLSPIFNLLLCPALAVVCVLSVFTTVAGLVPVVKYAAVPFVCFNELLIRALLAIMEFIDCSFSFAVINLSHPAFMFSFICALAAYIAAYFQLEKGRKRKIFVTAVSIAAFLCYNLLNWNVATVTAFDSGRECSFHVSVKGGEYLVLSENMTADEAERRLVSANKLKFDGVYYCPKEIKNFVDFDSVADNFVTVDKSAVYSNGDFVLTAETEKNKRLFTISVKDCDISFGHGKVSCNGDEYYFLGNDKPQEVTAKEIYIFGNIPKWMDVENINTVNSDVTIKINLKTGEYKTVEDVFNFGW